MGPFKVKSRNIFQYRARVSRPRAGAFRGQPNYKSLVGILAVGTVLPAISVVK